MKNRGFGVNILCFCLLFLLTGASRLPAEDLYTAPPKIQAGLFLKLLGFNKGIASGGDISIHVVASPEFAAAMKKAVGKAVGKGRLSSVTEGNSVPTEKPTVIYVGDSSKTHEVISYTRANKILSITGLPDQVNNGITLGVGVLGGKPKIMLNISSSKEEGVDWNPALLKIASVIK